MQAYSNPKRASDPHALPDVEIWRSRYRDCPECGRTVGAHEDCRQAACHECNDRIISMDADLTRVGYFYWFCLPGCLPDSEPIGPFETQEDALADAQQDAGDDNESE